MPSRHDTLYPTNPSPSSSLRSAGARDHDRILYSSAFRRLASITQVVSPTEGQVLHSRLTHSIKVSQIARRSAEILLAKQKELALALGIDPEVAAAAALAHDLGHPPFGHVAEEVLDRLMREAGDTDGFEGNAQSFRIVTKLSFRYEEFPGLNLTRATLNAILKYPWHRKKESPKFGAYGTESKEFAFAREGGPTGEEKSAEASLMDWADDITYAVHDLEDFFRAGILPLERLAAKGRELDLFLTQTYSRWSAKGIHKELALENLRKFADDIDILLPFDRPYSATRNDRRTLRDRTSWLVDRFVSALTILPSADKKGNRIGFDKADTNLKLEIDILKELMWFYVIDRPPLSVQQKGIEQIITTVFTELYSATSASGLRLLPPHLVETLERGESTPIRTICDYIASMTERQVVWWFSKFNGSALGSILDRVEL